MTDAVVVLSGGLDSSTLLAHLSSEAYEDMIALTFDYGQRHARELQSAVAVANHYDVEHHIVDLKSVGQLLGGSALTDDIDVPEGHYASENMKLTVVPNRNAIMANVAIGVAVARHASIVALGIHAGDHDVYPDCRPQFTSALEELAHVANDGFIDSKFGIETPFLYMNKKEIAYTADYLGVPIAKTWSCYKGGEIHCGRCATCVERIEAFHLAGVDDPTEYEDSTYWKEVV